MALAKLLTAIKKPTQISKLHFAPLPIPPTAARNACLTVAIIPAIFAEIDAQADLTQFGSPTNGIGQSSPATPGCSRWQKS